MSQYSRFIPQSNTRQLFFSFEEHWLLIYIWNIYCLLSVIQEKKDLQIEVSSSNDESDVNYKALEEKVETLETKHADCEKELSVTKDKLYAHDMAAKKAISSLKRELTLRVDQVTKMYEDCLRERDGLTLKVSQLTEEKQEISKMQDAIDKKLSEMAKVE